MKNFYDEVANKFGGYGFSTNKPKYTAVYPEGNPEAIFKERLLELASPSAVALDIGCGDGKFGFEIADKFSAITGLDSSKELIAIAERKNKELKCENMLFVFGEASKTPFQDQSFDIIFNRRGPSFYAEYFRLLKPGGYYIEIGIGEQDAAELKETFGRGQNFATRDRSRLTTDKLEFEKLGFELTFLENYSYDEQYLSKSEFELFLQNVPIFEDFDSIKDRQYLEAYYTVHLNGFQVKLRRQRVVYILKKPTKK